MKTILTTLTCIFVLVCLSSSKPWSSIKGNGKIISKTIDIEDYSKIEVSSAANLVYEQKPDAPAYLRVEIDQNLEEYIILKITGGKLIVSSKANINTKNYKIYTNSKTLAEVKVSGASNIKLKEKITSKNLSIGCSGASNLNAENLQCDKIDLDCSGASNILLGGTVKIFKIDISGASNLKAEQLQAENINIDCSGASKSKIFATNELKADASGSSNVKYKGTPKVINKTVSGSSKISGK